MNPKWTKSQPDLTPAECYTYLVQLEQMPLRRCDAPNCKTPAAWYVNLHGCVQRVCCEDHGMEWVAEVERSLSVSGEVACMNCQLSWTTLRNAIQWRPI